MIFDFDGRLASGFALSDGPGVFIRSGSLGLDPNISAPPPGDTSNYLTVTRGAATTLSAAQPLGTFSVFLGSPDAFNGITLAGEGVRLGLGGDSIWGGTPADAHGDQTIGRRISCDFQGLKGTQITFSPPGDAFEFDSLAGSYAAAAPEPASWALMRLGSAGSAACCMVAAPARVRLARSPVGGRAPRPPLASPGANFTFFTLKGASLRPTSSAVAARGRPRPR